MFWYETQFRHAEDARKRNKREERKLKIEIERKNGMRAVLKNQMEAVSKEQRRIKRELDRVANSSVGPTNVVNGIPRSRIQLSLPFHKKKSTRRMIGRIEPTFNFLTSEYNQTANAHENELMRSIMFFDSETNIKVNNGDIDKALNGHFNDLTTTSDSTIITGQHTSSSNCITDINNNTTSTLHSDGNLLHETPSLSTRDNTVSLQVSSPQRSSSLAHSFISTNDSRVECFDNEDGLAELKTDYPSNSNSSRSTGSTSKYRHKSLDLSQLASLDMKSVKSNVSRRLSGTTAPPQAELSRRRVSDGNLALAKPAPKNVPLSRRRISEVQSVPSPKKSVATNAKSDSKQKRASPSEIEEQPQPTTSTKRTTMKHSKDIPPILDYNPEYYNPDGTLRAMWNLPDPDEAWERAKNARYLRTSEIRENETELSINEIFN